MLWQIRTESVLSLMWVMEVAWKPLATQINMERMTIILFIARMVGILKVGIRSLTKSGYFYGILQIKLFVQHFLF